MRRPDRPTEGTSTESRSDATEADLAGLEPGERRTVSLSQIERAAGDVGEGEQRAYARAWLIHNGLRAEPDPREAKDLVTVRLTPFFALEAAAVIAVVFAAVAFAGRPIYGVVAALFGGLACVVLALTWNRVARSLPAWIPRGRALGLVAVAPFLLVAAIAIAGLRQQHISDVRRDRTELQVRDANIALDRGDIGGATSPAGQRRVDRPGRARPRCGAGPHRRRARPDDQGAAAPHRPARGARAAWPLAVGRRSAGPLSPARRWSC